MRERDAWEKMGKSWVIVVVGGVVGFGVMKREEGIAMESIWSRRMFLTVQRVHDDCVGEEV